jgi:hypothetical protein
LSLSVSPNGTRLSEDETASACRLSASPNGTRFSADETANACRLSASPNGTRLSEDETASACHSRDRLSVSSLPGCLLADKALYLDPLDKRVGALQRDLSRSHGGEDRAHAYACNSLYAEESNVSPVNELTYSRYSYDSDPEQVLGLSDHVRMHECDVKPQGICKHELTYSKGLDSDTNQAHELTYSKGLDSDTNQAHELTYSKGLDSDTNQAHELTYSIHPDASAYVNTTLHTCNKTRNVCQNSESLVKSPPENTQNQGLNVHRSLQQEHAPARTPRGSVPGKGTRISDGDVWVFGPKTPIKGDAPKPMCRRVIVGCDRYVCMLGVCACICHVCGCMYFFLCDDCVYVYMLCGYARL